MKVKNLEKIASRFHKNIKIFIEVCREILGENIVSIILFGSVANSKFNKLSDLDFCIITKRYPQEDWKIGGEIKYRCLEKGVFTPIEPIFLAEEDLDTPSPFLYEITHTGILLFGKDILTLIKKKVENIKPLMKGKIRIGWQLA